MEEDGPKSATPIDPQFVAIDLGVPYPVNTYCDGLTDDQAGFRLYFSASNEHERVQVRFAAPLAYRKIDEGDAFRTLATLPSPPRPIAYEVFNSEFLAWFSDERYGSDPPYGCTVRHFLFLAEDDCIDVLSCDPPEVQLVPRPLRS